MLNSKSELIKLLYRRIQYEQLINNIILMKRNIHDLNKFINRALELIGSITEVSRIYIYKYFIESETVSNTYEWTAPGISSEKDRLQNISVNSMIWWHNLMKENQIICYKDFEEIPDDYTKEILRPQRIKSILVVPLFVNNNYYGFLGFDECKSYRDWLEIDVKLLQSISIVMCQEIEKSYSYKSLAEEYNRFLTILDNIDEGIYISDTESYKIIYANKAIQKYYNRNLIGELCYEVLQNKKSPCEFCTNEIIKQLNYGPYSWEHFNPLIGKHFRLIDRIIRWSDGRDVRFEYAVDISKYKEIEHSLIFEKEQFRKSETEIKIRNTKLNELIESIIVSLNTALGQKDSYTSKHQEQVAQLVVEIAKEMNLSEQIIEGIKVAALLHDIGKIGIPAEILNKPNKLIPSEYSLIQEHVRISYEIIRKIEFPWPVADIILQHHEKTDGSGYPNGLRGDQILLEAKILAVADIVDAMSSHRPYRPALSIEKAIDAITKTQAYDEDVVEACIKVLLNKQNKKALEFLYEVQDSNSLVNRII